MSSLARSNKAYPSIMAVRAEPDKIIASLSDGREVSIPVAWFPRLLSATEAQRAAMELSPSGYGIHWPDIDEDISVKAFVDGL